MRAPHLASLVVALLLLSACTSSARPPAPPVLSEAERDQLIAEALDQQWAVFTSFHPDTERPDVDVVRYTSLSEQPAVLVGCLNDAGYDAELSSTQRGIVTEGTEAQSEHQDLALYVCQAQYPLDALYRAPLSESETEYLYDYYVGALTDCLREEGADSGAAPSYQRFRESYESEEAWSPYAALATNPAVSQQMFDALMQACPERPSGLRD